MSPPRARRPLMVRTARRFLLIAFLGSFPAHSVAAQTPDIFGQPVPVAPLPQPHGGPLPVTPQPQPLPDPLPISPQPQAGPVPVVPQPQPQVGPLPPIPVPRNDAVPLPPQGNSPFVPATPIFIDDPLQPVV